MSNIVPENILDEPIPASFRTPTMVPTRGRFVMQKLRQFNDWIISAIPEPIKRTVSEKLRALKETVSNIFSNKKITPKEIESALEGTVKTFRIKGGATDYKTFLQSIIPPTKMLLNEQSKPIKVMLRLQCQFRQIRDGEEIFTDYHFNTKSNVVDDGTNLIDFLSVGVERLIELIESLQGKGSGWVFDKVLHFDILVDQFKPLVGSSYVPLPKFLADKKAIINPKNINDDECFKWCVTEAVYPQNVKRERISKKSRENAKLFNWDGIKFPVKITQIGLFEKNNPEYSVNVLGHHEHWKFGKMVDEIHPIRISKHYTSERTVINLLLMSDEDNHHYVLVNSISRLVGMETNKHKTKSHICLNCFNTFSLEKSFKQHTEFCLNNETVKICMPDEDADPIMFKNINRTQKVPFVIYADFESFTEKIYTDDNYDESKNYTKKYQKHTPSGFCYYITYNGKFFKKPVVYTGENVADVFCMLLEKETHEIYNKYFKVHKPLRMTKDELNEYKKTSTCHFCTKTIIDENSKVKCYNRLSGKFIGAAHTRCNRKFKSSSFFIPVVLHNLSGYDAHLFIKQLGVSSGEINCIANNEEKYISFTKEILVDNVEKKDGGTKKIFLNNRFTDSFKFMSCGLDSLVKNLTNNGTDDSLIVHTKNRFQEKTYLTLRKGVYPYDYMDSPERLDETQLPLKSAFYSKLSDSDISDEDYSHAQKVWEEFGMTTMRDYHDLYLELDVLLLTDVFENFRKICLKNYKLDPAWYLTAPGLSWDAMLKITEVNLELLTDPDMLMMFEEGTRGGVSMISNRYSEANNKYMENFDESKPSKFIEYLDANNLYGWAMSEKMPYKDFKWVEDVQATPLEKMLSDGDTGYVLEVDLDYPEKLHDLHNDYPLAPESMEINKVNKLTPNLNSKTKYVLHHRNLKLYLSLGMELTKIHRVIEFKQSKWLAPYIALNTDLRTEAKNNFEKDFFKLMNNSVFGKTMENIRNRKDIQLVTSKRKALKLIAKPNFKHRTIFTNNLVAVHMGKTELYFNKPIYVGMSILDVSKTLMYDFHYNYIIPKYNEKAKLLFTDTDSFCYELETEVFFKDISNDVEAKFDTSAYPENHPSGIKTGVNKKVIGMMKDECSGKIMSGFVGLRAKSYATKMDDGVESKKCKGISKTVTKNDIAFEDYKNVLFDQTVQLRKMNVIRSHKHEIFTEEINKIALSGNDDKRVIMEDRIRTMAYGHYSLRKPEVGSDK